MGDFFCDISIGTRVIVTVVIVTLATVVIVTLVTVVIMTVVTVVIVTIVTVVIVTVATVAAGTVVIVTYFSKNNLTPRQQMQYSQGSFSRFSRCFFLIRTILAISS